MTSHYGYPFNMFVCVLKKLYSLYNIKFLWVVGSLMPGGGRRDPIVRNPAVALKETLMLGFIAKARFWQPQSVSCPLPLLLICPNKRSLLDAG